MASLPKFVRFGDVVHRLISNLQESALLKVWRCDAPAALEVAVETIAEDLLDGRVGSIPGRELCLRVR